MPQPIHVDTRKQPMYINMYALFYSPRLQYFIALVTKTLSHESYILFKQCYTHYYQIMLCDFVRRQRWLCRVSQLCACMIAYWSVIDLTAMTWMLALVWCWHGLPCGYIISLIHFVSECWSVMVYVTASLIKAEKEATEGKLWLADNVTIWQCG